jgi:hypothetical protein
VFSASPNYRGRYRNAATGYVVGNVLKSCALHDEHSHTLHGNAIGRSQHLAKLPLSLDPCFLKVLDLESAYASD